MDGTGEDTAEDDPKVGNGAEQRAAQGTEDGAGTGDVQQLNQENFQVGMGT